MPFFSFHGTGWTPADEAKHKAEELRRRNDSEFVMVDSAGRICKRVVSRVIDTGKVVQPSASGEESEG